MIGLPFVIFCYISLFFFVTAFLYRTIKIAKLPSHLRWELSPIPHEKGKGRYGGSYLEEYEWWTKSREKSLFDEFRYMLMEIVFLKGVWENNKKLWYFSFPFHIGMYLLAVAMILTAFLTIVTAGELTEANSILKMVISIGAMTGFIIGIVGTLGLLAKRLFDPNLKNFNTTGTYFNLVFLLSVFVSGFFAQISTQDFVLDMTRVVKVLFSWEAPITISTMVTLHCGLAFLFLAYLPFTRMMHFMAKYFTYHEVRWNDKPISGTSMETDVEKLLNQSVTWSAPHLKANGKKNWVEIVRGGGEE